MLKQYQNIPPTDSKRSFLIQKDNLFDAFEFPTITFLEISKLSNENMFEANVVEDA
jgi:hypothetical protein